ncbi:MAG: CdaR family protein [Desulfotomaculaceae bacterium]|nr:CdaR family protein [Desulfotomaculaceae bacterium]
MGRLDWQNNSLRLLAVFLALVMWIYVSNEQNPVREKILNVTLEHTGPAQNYIITGGLPESVRVRVQGNRNDLANLAPDDFRAIVNLPEDKTGDVLLPVQVSSPSNLRVAQVSPEEVTVGLDRLVERQIAVAVSLKGTPAQNYSALAPTFSPETVIVWGPSRIVNNISQASAVINIQDASSDVTMNVPLNTGAPNVTVSPATVQVVVPIVNAVASKNIPVAPQTTGSVAVGFRVIKSAGDPATVQIYGPVEVISNISEIRTEPVDIQGSDKNVTKEVGLLTPTGVTSIQPVRVKVLVEISKLDETLPSPGGDSGDTAKPEP